MTTQQQEPTGLKWFDDHEAAIMRVTTKIGHGIGMAVGVLVWLALIAAVVAVVAVPVWWLFWR